jgi:hypothetical protein
MSQGCAVIITGDMKSGVAGWDVIIADLPAQWLPRPLPWSQHVIADLVQSSNVWHYCGITVAKMLSA